MLSGSNTGDFMHPLKHMAVLEPELVEYTLFWTEGYCYLVDVGSLSQQPPHAKRISLRDMAN